MIDINAVSLLVFEWLRKGGELLVKFKPEYADILFAVVAFGLAYFFSDKIEGRVPTTLVVGSLLFLLLKSVMS